MISDQDLQTTTVAAEAGDQPYEGKVCVAIVIDNRKRIPYASDGTEVGTDLHKFAFSGYWSAMTHGEYQEVAFDLAQAEDRACAQCAQFKAEPTLWADCQRAIADAAKWAAGEPMSFTPGPAFAGITKKTVLYYNPKAVTTPPPWATAANRDAVIFDHTFFHDGAA